jgi:hypothetical protein
VSLSERASDVDRPVVGACEHECASTRVRMWRDVFNGGLEACIKLNVWGIDLLLSKSALCSESDSTCSTSTCSQRWHAK